MSNKTLTPQLVVAVCADNITMDHAYVKVGANLLVFRDGLGPGCWLSVTAKMGFGVFVMLRVRLYTSFATHLAVITVPYVYRNLCLV